MLLFTGNKRKINPFFFYQKDLLLKGMIALKIYIFLFVCLKASIQRRSNNLLVNFNSIPQYGFLNWRDIERITAKIFKASTPFLIAGDFLGCFFQS